MITISPFWFAFLIQVSLILLALSLFLFYRIRKLKVSLAKEGSGILAGENESGESVLEPDLQHYLTTEIKLTRGRIDSLFTDQEEVEFELVEPDWLQLRESYLQLELEFADDKTREDAFWKTFGDRIKRLLTSCRLVKRLTFADITNQPQTNKENLEAGELNKILQEQAAELEDLVKKLDSSDSNVDDENLRKGLDSIARKYREVYHCVFTVEDENKFLRDQIQALLVLDSQQS